jgi:hypothetical protein
MEAVVLENQLLVVLCGIEKAADPERKYGEEEGELEKVSGAREER